MILDLRENNFLKKLLNGRTIIIVASIVYLFIALFVNKNYISPDGRSYQRMAVNIAEGNGFSNSVEAPYEPQFFREPGFPFFFSLACWANKNFGNNNVAFTNIDSKDGYYYDDSHTEILFLRIFQALLAILTVWFFYKTTLFFLKPNVATLISLLFIFYLPFSVFITFPQREILVTALLSIMGYLFIKSAKSENSTFSNILFGLLSAALVLTLQAYIFILPIFLFCYWFLTKSLKKTITSALIIGFVFALGVMPWIIRAYNSVKDVRVAKTFGIAYTYEFKKFHDTFAKAYWINFEGRGESFKERIIKEYNESGETMFKKSFNGYFINKADSLNNVLKAKAIGSYFEEIKYQTKHLLTVNFRKALIWPLWKDNYRMNIFELKSNNNGSIIIALGLGVILCFLGIIGIILFIRKTWFFLPVFVFHALMIPFIADEGRRMLPFLPFYFMFFAMALIFLYNYRFKKEKKEKSF